MESVWMQLKGSCERMKEETNAKDEHIRKMLQEIADYFYPRENDLQLLLQHFG